MRLINNTIALLLILALAQPLFAQAKQKKAAKAKKQNPAYAQIEDDPNLPRVLLIGDSISIGYTVPTRKCLEGKANLHRPAANCGSTQTGLDSLDKWLGEGKWDVIHFNWGLHDLKYLEGQQVTPLAQYETNLRKLVQRLKQTGAKLIWCSTTPVPEGKLNPPRSDQDVQAYNAVAAKIMQEEGIAIDDLYAFALPKLTEIQRPVNVHFTPEGSQQLAEQVAKNIAAALK